MNILLLMQRIYIHLSMLVTILQEIIHSGFEGGTLTLLTI